MELERAIRTRRTHKAFGSEPVAPDVLGELFELARWAPHHHVTNPWRFRVLGPKTARCRLGCCTSVRRASGSGCLNGRRWRRSRANSLEISRSVRHLACEE